MEHSSRHITTFYFLSLGVFTVLPKRVILWIAIEDILAGTLWPSAIVLISYSGFEILSKVLSVYIVNRISFRSSFCLFTFLLVGSVTLIVVIDDVRLRLVGVGVLGIADGLTIITCVRMLAYYEEAGILANAYENGVNISTFLASVIYTGLSTWLCVAPRIAVATCIPASFVPLVFYVLLDKEPLDAHLKKKITDRKEVKYSSLNESSDERTTATQPSMPMHKLIFIVRAFPPIIYCYVTNFCLHFTMTNVLTTLTFPSSPFPPRDHYQYYRFLSDAGLLIGSMINLFSWVVRYKWIEFFRVRRIWILVVLNVIHLLFFVVASWYRFLPNVIPVLVLCFTQGLVAGSAFVNCCMRAANLFSYARDKGKALSLVEIATSASWISLSLLGLFVEKYLREHCTYQLVEGRFCLARHASHAEWNTNSRCSMHIS